MAEVDTALLDPNPTPGAPGLTLGATGALANPPPPPAPDPEAQARAEYVRAQTQRLEAAGQREQEAYEQKKKKLEPFYNQQLAAGQQLIATSNEQTQRLQEMLQPIPPYNPPGDMRKQAGDWMMLAAGFGAIAGAFSRYHTTTALNAFAGMLNGFNKGSLQAIDTNYQTWEANAKQAESYNRQVLTRYKAIMDNAQLNWDVKAAQIKMIADQYQDDIMSSAAEQKNITQMMEIYDKKDMFAERMQFARERLENQKNYQQQFTQRLKDRQQLLAIGSALRTDENKLSALNTYEPIAKQNGRTLRQLISKVSPTEYSDLNSFYQALARKGGDQDVSQFKAALLAWRTEVGRIVNNPNLTGVLAVKNQAEMDQMLPEGSPPGVINRVTKFFDQDVDYKRGLLEADRKYQQGRIDAYGTTATPPPLQPPEAPPVIPPGTETPTVPSDDIEVVQ